MKKRFGFALIWLALICSWGQVLAQAPPAGFTSTVISSGWNEAVGLTFTSSGSKMFVWERPGKVWVVVNGQRQLVLDISDEVGAWGDHGLIGFALDPQFDSNRYMYLLYVVDREHLLYAGTANYDPNVNDYYSATIGRLTRYTVIPDGAGFTADPSSRKILLGATKTTGIAATFGAHVAAGLVFGTDGTLLVGTGDGAHWAPDLGSYSETAYAQALNDGIIQPKENVGALRSQLVDCLNGKILRLDPATGAGVPSNPFYDAANPNAPRSKVWAMGFRNPFRMSLKPGTGSTNPGAANPGVLYVGDVGASSWEEISVIDRPRMNMGWPLFEGLMPYAAFANSNVYNQDAPNPRYNTGGCTQQYFYFRDLIKQATPSGTATFPNPCDAGQTIPTGIPTFLNGRPLVEWGHGSGPSRTGTYTGSAATAVNLGEPGSPVSGSQFGGNASVGGVFYPYNDFPAPYRNTFFFGDYVGSWVRSLTVNDTNQPSAVNDFINTGAVPVGFATSPGETGLFYVNFYPSEIRKISYGTTNTPPVAVATADKSYGAGPLTVQFTGSNSSDPGGSPLTYLWDFGDGITSTAANPVHTFTPATPAAIKYRVTLTVSDSQGLTNQAALVISVNNTPPQVTITSPAANTMYPITGNTTYNLRATVTDAEQSGAQLTYQWQTILHHESHEHPNPVDTNPQTTTTLAPYGCGAETYYYRIVLTVTDAGGLSTTREVRLNPNCSTPGFTLVNTDNNLDIQSLVNGAILNLPTLPTRNLNIRANASPASTGSVVFALSGAQTRAWTENTAPYALFSDNGGAYNPWTPSAGNYSLTATPYTEANGGGTAGPPLAIMFSVTDSGSPGPFSLTTTVSGSGLIGRNPDQTSYANGTSVTLTATAAAGFQFAGWSGDATGTDNPLTVTMNANKTITATFTAVTGPQAQLSSFTLVNADTNADIQPLTTGSTLNLATLPTRRLNIRANTSPATVGSVVFALSGAQIQNQTESVAPYALFSDNGGVYTAWTPATGSYVLKATPYSAGGGGGTAGTPLSISFSVTDQSTPPPPAATSPYMLVDADNNSDIQPIISGSTLNLATLPTRNLNIRVNPTAATVGSVILTLTGAEARTQTENTAPYALFSDIGGDYNAWTPKVGTYALSATPYSGASGSGTAGTVINITFTVTDQAPTDPTATAVSSYTLVNAETNRDIQFLTTGSTLNLATLPTRRLNIRANTSPATVGSVVFALSGAQIQNQTESVAPYALFSDNGGVYTAWTPATGSYVLKATPYSAGGGGGTAGTPLSISFSVTDQAGRLATSAAVLRHIGTASAYPNPSSDGRFHVQLPAAFQGPVRYRLVTALGTTVSKGTFPTAANSADQLLDFSREIAAAGLYYLLLENAQGTAEIKLMKN